MAAVFDSMYFAFISDFKNAFLRFFPTDLSDNVKRR